MRVFVTGGTGFIGSHVVKRLVEEGHEVTVISRQPASFPWPVRVEVGEYWTRDALKLIQGHDAVIHCAIVWGIEDEEREFRDVWCTSSLLESAMEAGVQAFIYTSSVAVHRPFSGLMNETSPMKPTDLYGNTKWRTEEAISQLTSEKPMRVAIIRPGPTVGPPAFPGASHKSDSRFIEYISSARSNEEIRPDGMARQFTGVSDLAKVYSATLGSQDFVGPLLAVSEEPTSWDSIAAEIVKKVKSASKVMVGFLDEETPRFDVTRLRTSFGLRLDASGEIGAHIDHLLARL